MLSFRVDKNEVTSIDDICRQISEDNDRRIEGMSEEQGKRRDIIKRFGGDPGDGDNLPLSLSASSYVHCRRPAICDRGPGVVGMTLVA